MGPFNRLLVVKTIAFTAICAVIIFFVGAITDEPSNGFAEALARWCALVPAAAGLGASLALSQARSRGELLPLEALGLHPLRATLPALLAAWACSFGALAVLASPVPQHAALFPLIPEAPTWELRSAEASLPALGVRMTADGFVTKTEAGATPATADDALSRRRRAVLLVLPLALLVPAWGVVRQSVGLRLVSGALALALQIALFHASALRPASLAFVIAASFPLAGAALWSAWRPRLP